ncbi:MAG: hypothetical protein K2X61_08885 [Caulobacteraceae bacterium]|nr:hypothetical protein [Caulobacteraceae bacterium]
MNQALILCDLVAPDGTVCGVELRQGVSLDRSHVCCDVLFTETRWRERARAWIAAARANGERIDDRRTVQLEALTPAIDEPMQPRRWGDDWTCRYPGERPAHQPLHRTPGEALEAARARMIAATLADQAEPVTLADGPALQGVVPGVAPVPLQARQIEALQHKRAARRGSAPLPSGGLFDDVARAQQELF